jgi:ABC-type polysaccharide/polyol phosphate export permease
MTAPEPRPTRTKGFSLSGPTTPLPELVRGIWESRALLALLSRKEFFVRYRRASFGVLWAVVLPLLQAIVLAVVVNRFVRFDTGGNFTLFVFAGTLAWSFFSQTISGGTTSIVDNADMSAKIYFPRALFPLVVVGAGLYGLLISTLILLAFAIGAGELEPLRILLIVPAIAVLVLLSTAAALLLSALHVYFRDMKYLVAAALLPWFYLTPVFYPLDRIGALRGVVEANPVSGAVELLRAATVGADHGWSVSLWWTAGWTVALFVLAAIVHRRHDRVMSDLL